MKMFSLNTLNLQNEMNNMEKKKYIQPSVAATKLDSDINLVLMSPTGENTCWDEASQSYITCFINPLKRFK
jgi:hypothetical protein